MNWFQRHLNWTVVLLWAALLSTLLGIVILIESYGSEEISEDFVIRIIVVVWVAGIFSVAAWALKQKRQSLWYLLLLVIPFVGWIIFLGLRNQREVLDETIRTKTLVHKANQEKRQTMKATIGITILTVCLIGVIVLAIITQSRLIDTMIELDNTKTKLTDVENQLDITRTQLSTTTTQLNTIETEITITRNQLVAAKNENTNMLDQYDSLKEQINLRLGLNQSNRQSFITPNNTAVSAKAKEIAGSYSENINEYWRDFQILYDWVVKNIEYSSDSYMPVLPEVMAGAITWQGECWKTPEETLRDKTGDCEDMSVLLTSMLRSYNKGKYVVWILSIESNYPERKGHVAVAFPVTGGKLTILDPAGNYYTGYQNRSIQAESASVAVSKWLSHWSNKMPGAEIDEVFSESIYHRFSGTNEFLTWLEDRNS